MRHSLTRETLWTAIVTFTLCSFAFSERLNSIGITLLAIHWLVDTKLLEKAKRIFTQKNAWVLLSFFALYLLYFLFSEKDISASHSLESKLSFLLLPLFLSTENYFYERKELIFQLFCWSLMFSFFYALANSYYVLIIVMKKADYWSVFNRMHISMAIMHPGYYSNYFMMAILYLFFNKLSGRIFFISLFTIAVILLLSRIVLLFYMLFVIVLSIQYLLSTNHKLLKTAGLMLLALIIGWSVYQIPTVQSRFKESLANINNTNKNTKLSSATATRRIAYEQEWELIKNNPWQGYGLGSANELLRNKLYQSGYKALSKEMSTHNQYFSNWLSMGLTGILALLTLLIYLLYFFHKEKLKTAWWFTLLVTLYLTTDDMLDVQAGVVFFVLIWSLSLFQKKGS